MNRILILVIASGFLRAQDLAAVVKRGEAVFASTCSVGYCHGSKGSVGSAPRLAARGFDQNYIATTVARGISGTAMPPFATTLPRADFAAVVAYVATLNGVTNSSLGGQGSIPPTEPEAPPSAEGARGRALFSEAVRGFGRCSTCHEVDGIGISVATPMSQIPASVSAFRSMSTPQVSTARTDTEAMPALVVSNTKRALVFYDLTTPPPVLRTLEPSALTLSTGSSWRHSSVIESYRDEELGSILEYLRAVLKP